MRTEKKVLWCLLVFLLVTTTFVSSKSLYAQTATDWDAIRQEIKEKGQPVDGLEIPYLEAREVTIDDTAYWAGSLINGSFVVRNGGSVAAERIVPAISLIGNFDGKIPTASYETDNSQESFSLEPGEQKTINFTYKLPDLLMTTDLGLQVEFFTDTGLRQDSIITRFSGRGELQQTSVTFAELQLRDRGYGLKTTPMVYADDILTVAIDVNTTESITIRPELGIYDFSSVTGDLVREKTYDERTLSAGETQIRLDVPETLPDGMFEGRVSFFDEDDQKVVQDVIFLFMKMTEPGFPFRIRNITVDTLQDDTYEFSVSYTGGAPDIDLFLDYPDRVQDPERSDDEAEELIGSVDSDDSILPSMSPDFIGKQVRIEVKDNSGAIVGRGSVDATEADEFMIDIPVVMPMISSGVFEVRAYVQDANGKTLNEYQKQIEITASAQKQKEEIAKLNVPMLISAIAAFIIVIFVLMLLVTGRRSRERQIITNNK